MSEHKLATGAHCDVRQIGHRLFAMRVDLGLSRQQIADALNIPLSDMQDVENGACKADVEMLIGIATEFPQVSLHWLLTGHLDLVSTRDDLSTLSGHVSIRVTGSTVNIICQQPPGSAVALEQTKTTPRGTEARR